MSTADLDGLLDCLDSLEKQDISPESANEALLINSGDVPKELIDNICQKYPWIGVQYVDPELDYYDSKMHGVKLATSEIIIFADSDCCYKDGWLRSMLTPFSQDASVQVIGGETSMAIKGPYSLAMAMTYIFPPFSRKPGLYESSGYFCNNVAFRREFLMQHPIPSKLPIYRGNCSAHSSNLKNLGYTIWRQPQSRATHAPPENLFHFFWRFLLMGSDDWLMGRKSQDLNTVSKKSTSAQLLFNRFHKAFRRGRTILREKPSRLIYLPLALPIAIASLLLMCIGFVVAIFGPFYLLNHFEKLEHERDQVTAKTMQPSVLTEQ
ncbi:MAG: glycosyltransferase [Elainellaceae cyanobacterium]